MRTLIVCLMFALAACAKGGADAPVETPTIFFKWDSAYGAVNKTWDFTGASYGATTMQLIRSDEGCTCVADITGDASAGSIDTHTCTHVSGAGAYCTGSTAIMDSFTYTVSDNVLRIIWTNTNVVLYGPL